MKRPTSIVDPSGGSRRKRALSKEELTLWDSVARQVKPLRKRHSALKPPVVSAPPLETKAAAKPAAAVKPVAVKASETPRPHPPPLAPLGRRERSHLARGRKEIEARLDLHGMTQARAHRMLLSFLQRAHGNGLSFVLVITGKGKAGTSESERGVLRRQVPEWLSLPEFRSLVVGFEQAHIGHGGEGALYVRVRRARA
jgi:DNA-nicking Smr family endonuclease